MHDIPEKAVKAVIGVPVSGPYLSKEEAVEIIEAALPFLPMQGAVKKLEWWVAESGDVIADSIVGRYRLGKVTANINFRLETPSGLIPKPAPDYYWPEDEAKAAAQADYEARILSALEPSAARELVLEEGRLIELLRNAHRVLGGGGDEEFQETVALNVKYALEEYEAIRTLSSPDHADAGKVEGDGWRPIETAPKDGTIVLLGWNDPDIEEIGAVAGWYEGGPADKCWYDQYHEPVTATHWMPLRPLPSAPSEGAE